MVPAATILLEQQHGLTIGAGPGTKAGRLDLHQGEQAVRFGFFRNEGDEDAPQAHRLLTEFRPHPVRTGGCRITLVEDQVDHLEH